MPAILLKLPEQPDENRRSGEIRLGAGCDPKHRKTFERRFGFPLVEALGD
jgi:crotonobetaine/carnitine-CoA ligase